MRRIPNPPDMEKLTKEEAAFLQKHNVPANEYHIGLTLRRQLLTDEELNLFYSIKQKRLVQANIYP